MLPFFPTPYEDELLYSVCARYHKWSHNPTFPHTLFELFGSKTASAIIDFPSRLDALVSNLPEGCVLTAERILDKNTLYPIYRLFLPPKRAKGIEHDMRTEDRGTAISMAIGAMASTVPSPKFLRLCVECLKQDEIDVGESYWHRVHQCPGVFVCPKHKVPLLNSQVLISSRNNKYVLQLPSLALVQPIKNHLSKTDSERAMNIAMDVHWLLTHHVDPVGTHELLRRYRRLLTRGNWMTARGNVRQSDLILDFQNHYKKIFLNMFGSDIESSPENWLSKMVRSARTSTHPIRHILLLQFLNEPISEFLKQSSHNFSHPFGNGPWPCLNAAASHYRDFVIDQCKVSRDYKLKIPVGTFSCTCGFVYSRRGPDTSEGDRFRIGRIKVFGDVFDKAVEKIHLGEGCSLRETARRLRVDPKTIKERMKVLEKASPATTNPNVTAAQVDALRASYRKRWLDNRAHHVKLSQTELRRLLPGVFAWLYRNDREWLKEHCPQRVKRTSHSYRVDWASRDGELAAEVRRATEEIRSFSGRPVQVTVSSIGSQIGKLGIIQKHICRLPETNRTLQEVTETKEAYQIRRVSWAAEQMRQQGIPVQEWSLIRSAGLRPGFSALVERQINEEVHRNMGL